VAEIERVGDEPLLLAFMPLDRTSGGGRQGLASGIAK
jgi:hypothetical protein